MGFQMPTLARQRFWFYNNASIPLYSVVSVASRETHYTWYLCSGGPDIQPLPCEWGPHPIHHKMPGS